MNSSPKLLYVSFDIVPSPKGAAVHIAQFARTLAARYGALQLVTVSASSSDGAAPHSYQERLAPGIEHLSLPAFGNNFLDRVLCFRRFLENWCSSRYFDIVHFRSPFEGYWLAQQKGKIFKRLVFEVNALPSVELKYRYPQIAEDIVFLEKLIGQEQYCLTQADHVITPSRITANFLKARGLDESRIRVIPNAVDLELFRYLQPNPIKNDEIVRLLYFGTLSAWQGVEQALNAVELIKREFPVHLNIVGAGKAQQLAALKIRINRLGIESAVTILPPCAQSDLLKHIHDSHIVLAPLSANDRNLQQGCCPFKILEAMACGRPLIASALPVVQEIAGDDPSVLLAKAGSAASIRDRVVELKESPELLLDSVQRARLRIEENFSLDYTGQLLCQAYDELLNSLCSIASI